MNHRVDKTPCETTEQYIDKINRYTLDESKRTRILLAEVLNQLERIEDKLDSVEGLIKPKGLAFKENNPFYKEVVKEDKVFGVDI